MNHVTFDSWTALLARLHLADTNGAYAQLNALYGEPGRAYHTLAHIDDCLDLLATCDEEAAVADRVGLALWFHDAVYNWRSTHNEADSAAMARHFLEASRAPDALIMEVCDLIMATCHSHLHLREGTAALISDIDLSIFGRAPSIYDRYETAIRQEYAAVPAVIYCRERKKVLQSFIARPAIYLTPTLADQFETRARENLARACAAL